MATCCAGRGLLSVCRGAVSTSAHALAAPRIAAADMSTTVIAGLADEETVDFPGAKVPTCKSIEFAGGASNPLERFPCYRALRSSGEPVPNADVPNPIQKDLAVKMHEVMVRLQVMDLIFYEAQRQGRFSFYMTSNGEEATVVGSAAALSPSDEIFAQYREQGALLWRGYTVEQMANQCFSNMLDPGKGRQMPVHYGSKELHFQQISSPLTTQLPHAVGAGHALKLEHKDRLSVAYFGDGAASEGDFHAAINFAATLDVPMLFICRNNGWAISTPAHEQYRGDGIAGRGPGYGVATVRVDGADALAVYNVIKEARKLALKNKCPVLVECMSYRSGHHSTSDDSTKYRSADEIQDWKVKDPVVRFQTWITSNGWWDDEMEQRLRQRVRREVLEALDKAERVPPPPLSDMFTDVYDAKPWHLEEQEAALHEHLRNHPEDLPPGMALTRGGEPPN